VRVAEEASLMSGGRTVWWAKDSAWWRREAIVELGEEFGAAGPAVLDWLACEAKAQNDGGMVRAGYRAIARGCFVELVTVRDVVSRAVALGALEDLAGDDRRFDARISGWQNDQERARGAMRTARWRDGSTDGAEPTRRTAAAERRDNASRSVTVRDGESLTGQDRREGPPLPPASGGGPDTRPGEGDSAPVPPVGGREREKRAFERQLEQFAARHFPGIHHGYIRHEAARLRRARREPTVTALAPLVEKYRPLPDDAEVLAS
jgi:hypothetical protein